MKFWDEPSPSDWERWEYWLEQGTEPSAAAKLAKPDGSLTCSAFRRADPVRHRATLDKGREARAQFVDAKVEAWALDEKGSDSMRQFWARRWQPEYAQTKLEIGGPNGGPIEIEDRSASLADLARVLEAAGALAGLNSGAARVEVPHAPAVLAAPVDG